MSLQESTYDKNEIVVKLPLDGQEAYQTVFGKKSSIKGEIEEFRGIPYGTVSGRWQHAKLRKNLPTDVYDATSNGPRCSQPFGSNNTDGWQSHLDFPDDVAESEFDCLNLFIARPSQQTLRDFGLDGQSGHLPVYVYIHGGGYAYGAGTDPMWDPARLIFRSVELKKPFIAVNINYRLSIFGFAASSDIIRTQGESTRGCNFALTDQRLALEWVSRNIAAFGGDPQRITVGGQSAGAVSAHAHVLDAKYSPGEPLISGGIIQSAALGLLGPIPLSEAEKRWQHLCKTYEVTNLSPADRVAKLALIPTKELLEVVVLANWGTFHVVHDDLTVSSLEGGDWKFSLNVSNENIPTLDDVRQNTTLDILIGDTDVEGSVYADTVVGRIKTSAQIQSAIKSSRASESAVLDIMQHYKLDQDCPLTILRERLYSFLTDITFGIAVDRAWHKMSISSSRSLHSQPTNQTKPIQYRAQFGNPFDGPNYDVAQHCVDLIYIYDDFHNDLRAVDRKAVSCGDTDRGSNHTLVELIQRDWIGFITTHQIHDVTSEDDIIVYGRDRRRRVIPKFQDKEYQERQVKFEVIERHWDDADRIFKALRTV